MNFKNIISFTVLAFLSIANAVPVAIVSESIETTSKVTRATKSLPDSYTIVNEKAKLCKEKSGIQIKSTSSNNTIYACLVKYGEGNESNRGINPENSYCLLNGNDILCVDSELSNAKYCDKNGSEYGTSEDSCFASIYELTGDIELERPAIGYPSMEKHVVTPRRDQYDCKMKGGIVVTYQVIYQYMCFAPSETFENTEDIYCATLNGKRYCYDENLSRSCYCDLKKSYYYPDACKYVLNQYSTYEGITLEDY